jgi:hypothetical protein
MAKKKRAAVAVKKPARSKREFVHICVGAKAKPILTKEAQAEGRTLSNYCSQLIIEGRKARKLRAFA